MCLYLIMVSVCPSSHFIQVFTSVALFNILISPLNAFPWVINGLMEAWVSAKRVQVFLQLEEIDWTQYYVGYNTEKGEGEVAPYNHAVIRQLWIESVYRVQGIFFLESNFTKQRERDSTAVNMQDATFSWRLENPISDAQQDNHSSHSDMNSKKLYETENAAVIEWKLCNVNLFIPAVSQTSVFAFYIVIMWV